MSSALKLRLILAETSGRFYLFLFFLAIFLVLFAAFFALLMFVFGKITLADYTSSYFTFSPLTIILPLILGLTIALSFRKSTIIISPSSRVNMDMLQEFFLKNGYKQIAVDGHKVVYEKASFSKRMFWLNLDKPTIDVINDEVHVTVKKKLEVILTPLIAYGKKFELT